MTPDRRFLSRRSHEILAREVGLCFLFYGAYYLVWRAGWTLNMGAPWLAVPLLAAEALAFIEFALFFFMTWHVPEVTQTEAPRGLKVDVYITTYNEDPALLRSTILGAVHMRYPHETYVLDDGQRPEVRALAEALGARYLTRQDRTHAKAGNINHALTQTHGDFIAIFDADHVPYPQFLDRVLGRFADERVALVQTPQEFYNLDSIQHAGDPGADAQGRWHEQSLFYRVIQPGKERLNSVFWCGSNAVLRRAAIDSIGGIATETITEDIHTTIKLHRAGWRTAYHNEVLATGIAPDDLDAFLTQRKRWAQGAMQVLRSRDNPLWARGLTLPQRLSYWASMSTYFSSFQKLVLIATPLVVLSTGILPMRAFGLDFLAHFAPYAALGLFANSLSSRGYGRYFDTERFNLLKAFAFVQASASLLLPRRLRFQVTRKSQLEERSKELWLTAPYALIIIASVGAIGWAAGTIADAERASMRLALALTALWAVYNAGVIGLALRAVLRRSHRRASYRFERRVPVQVEVEDGDRPVARTTTVDLNSGGLSFLYPERLAAGLHARVRIDIGGARPVEATAVVVNAHPADADGAAYRVGARFIDMGEGARDALTLFLFSNDPRPAAGEPPAAAA
ncbi:MAG TPA: glycosyltransferase [Dehalococcoidia bacterium]|nr:glycosyltransferase [Dehalococcoidia bacterium]